MPETVVAPELIVRVDPPIILAFITPPVEVIGPVREPLLKEPPLKFNELTGREYPPRLRMPPVCNMIGDEALKAVEELTVSVAGLVDVLSEIVVDPVYELLPARFILAPLTANEPLPVIAPEI